MYAGWPVLGPTTGFGVSSDGGVDSSAGSVTGGGVCNSVGGVSEWRSEVKAPPELRITTLAATRFVWVLSDGDCAVVVLAVVCVVDGLSVLSDVVAGGVEEDLVSVGLSTSSAFVESGALVALALSGSGVAHATPGVVATAIPTPSATANAPTRPTCFA